MRKLVALRADKVIDNCFLWQPRLVACGEGGHLAARQNRNTAGTGINTASCLLDNPLLRQRPPREPLIARPTASDCRSDRC